MVSSAKTTLNACFFLSTAAGFLFIIFGDRFIPEAAILIPSGIVLLYALICGRVLSVCGDRSYADHQIDSIYFIGFIFTLVSLVSLFYRLYRSGLSDAGETTVAETFLYAGISVATSLAGVLGRNLVRSSYLRGHPDSDDDAERAYATLRIMAEDVGAGYRETLEAIKVFLAEREETVKSLAVQEKRYVETLERLSDVLEGFADGLAVSGKDLTGRASEMTGDLDRLGRLFSGFAESSERIRREAEAAPFAAVTGELERFETGARELNGVLDSLIEVLEARVERVR